MIMIFFYFYTVSGCIYPASNIGDDCDDGDKITGNWETRFNFFVFLHVSDRTEMSLMRWMCVFTLKGRKKSTELGELVGLASVSLVIEKGSLRQFGDQSVNQSM